MKVLCPSCERLVELVDLRVERGGLIARCPACGAEQRQQLPARPVTVPSAKAATAVGTKDAPRTAPAPADEDENDEGPTIILLTPTSDAVPLAVAPPGTSAPPKPAEVARFDSPTKPPAIAPITLEAASPPRRVVDAEFAQLLNQLGDVPPTPPPQARAPEHR
jgi:hypothetical protein